MDSRWIWYGRLVAVLVSDVPAWVESWADESRCCLRCDLLIWLANMALSTEAGRSYTLVEVSDLNTTLMPALNPNMRKDLAEL